MKENLFANVEDKKAIVQQDDYYKDVLEKRTRPAIPGDEEKVSATVDKADKPYFEIHELKKYDIELVRQKATEYFKGDAR